MSLVVTVLIAAGGAIAAGAVVRALSRRRADSADDSAAKPSTPSALAVAGFDLELGDVVSVRGEEIWLESGWLLTEDGSSVAALLFGAGSALLALPAPRATLFELVDAEVAVPSLAADPPGRIDHAACSYERARRLPVSVAPVGASADPPFAAATFSEYRALDGTSLWLLASEALCKAWVGTRLESSDVERWGGGASTLR